MIHDTSLDHRFRGYPDHDVKESCRREVNFYVVLFLFWEAWCTLSEAKLRYQTCSSLTLRADCANGSVRLYMTGPSRSERTAKRNSRTNGSGFGCAGRARREGQHHDTAIFRTCVSSGNYSAR